MIQPGSPHYKQGMAMLFMMLIFIASSIIAAALIDRQNLELARTSKFLNHTQALHYAYGAEAYVKQLLANEPKDGPPQKWGAVAPPFGVPDGKIEMEIVDLSGLFNINSLLANDEFAQMHFRKLCIKVGIDPIAADVLFVRFDQNSSDNPNILRPQGLFADKSELLDYGFPPAYYRILAPYITALPFSSDSININVASDVMLSVYLFNDDQLKIVHSIKKEKGFISDDDLTTIDVQDAPLLTSSSAFLMRARVKLGGQDLWLISTYVRSDSSGKRQVNLASRTFKN